MKLLGALWPSEKSPLSDSDTDSDPLVAAILCAMRAPTCRAGKNTKNKAEIEDGVECQQSATESKKQATEGKAYARVNCFPVPWVKSCRRGLWLKYYCHAMMPQIYYKTKTLTKVF